jgi:hypothetical protein
VLCLVNVQSYVGIGSLVHCNDTARRGAARRGAARRGAARRGAARRGAARRGAALVLCWAGPGRANFSFLLLLVPADDADASCRILPSTYSGK